MIKCYESTKNNHTIWLHITLGDIFSANGDSNPVLEIQIETLTRMAFLKEEYKRIQFFAGVK